jgi:hypothetical protein
LKVTTTEVTISVNCFCGDPTGEFLPKLMAEGPLWDTFKYYVHIYAAPHTHTHTHTPHITSRHAHDRC